jgi:chitinase
MCRSEWGYCGAGSTYCNAKATWSQDGCTDVPEVFTTTPHPTAPSPPTPPPSPLPEGEGIGSWFTQADFDAFFPNIDNPACTGANFFTYDALVKATKAFPQFANSGDLVHDKLELAAFLGQTSHETTGGWATAPGGPQAWGYCFKEERGCESGQCTGYCASGNPCAPQGIDCTCVAGKTYQGRGPVQLSWNYNYAAFSEYIYGDPSVLLKHPGRVATDAKLAYQAGLWFWMTPQTPKPSCHDVIAGLWEPTASDTAMGRVRGYGMTSNIINGGLECNMPTNAKIIDRVEYYKRYAAVLNVEVEQHTLYCDQMTSYR